MKTANLNKQLELLEVDFSIPDAASFKWQKLALELKEVWDVSKKEASRVC